MTVEADNSLREGTESVLDQDTQFSLVDLKKEIAEEVINKMIEKNPDSLSLLFKKTAADYLVDEWTLEDRATDAFMWAIWSWLDFLSPELEKYREMMNTAKTKSDLESLKVKIFNEIDWVQEQNPSQQDEAIRDVNNPGTGTTQRAKIDTSSASYEIDHFDIIASQEARNLYDWLKWKEKPDLEPFACALKVYNTLKSQNRLKNSKYMTVVDFTKNKSNHRFFVINMETNTVEDAVNVWHWKNTGWDWAKQFSNRMWSNQTSLWGYLLPDQITKSPNKSWSWLRQITWIEDSNSNSAARWIAVHPWWENLWSEWCFTLPNDVSRSIMEKIKWTFLFAYAKDSEYFAQSQYFSARADWAIAA